MKNTHRTIDPVLRYMIIGIICSILVFAYISIFEVKLSYWTAKEENFIVAEALKNQIDKLKGEL